MVEIFCVLGQQYMRRFPQQMRSMYLRHTAGQSLYNPDFGFTCLGLSKAIFEAEFERTVSQDLVRASLFLRMPDVPNESYELAATVRFLRENAFEVSSLTLMEEQHKDVEPTTDESAALHDGEILTLLTRDPAPLLEYVIRATHQTIPGAASNLIKVMRTQQMYTRVGRAILTEIAPIIAKRLEDFIHENSSGP